MAVHIRLNKADILEILCGYNINSMVQFCLLEGGSTNTNYFVAADHQRKFVLTICDTKSFEETLMLAKLLDHLDNHQFETSKVVRDKAGEAVTLFKQKPMLLKGYISGKVIDQYSQKVLQNIGTCLARLHQIPVPDYIPKSFPYGEQIFGDLGNRFQTHPFVKWLVEKKDTIKKSLLSTLPKSLVHGDVFFNNIIVGENQHPVIMDFEEAGYYYRIFDLGMAIVGVCCKEGSIVLSDVHALIKGYQDKIKLTPLEKENLRAFIVYAAVTTAFWRFRQFNLVYPSDHSKESYREMVHIADQAFNLSNEEIFG